MARHSTGSLDWKRAYAIVKRARNGAAKEIRASFKLRGKSQERVIARHATRNHRNEQVKTGRNRRETAANGRKWPGTAQTCISDGAGRRA
jgi:hypothetical protein